MKPKSKVIVRIEYPKPPYSSDIQTGCYTAHFIKMGKQRIAKHIGPRILVSIVDEKGEHVVKDLSIHIHPTGTITVESSEDYVEVVPNFLEEDAGEAPADNAN